MEVLDAKMINTKFGIETYLDINNLIEIEEVNIPTSESPYFDLKIRVKYYRLRKENYYDSLTNYFWIRVHPDLNSLTLLETDIQSLFSVKDREEREATKELIGEWMIHTNAFKRKIKELIKEKREANFLTEEEIREALETIGLLEKALELKPEEVISANIEAYN